MTKDDAISEVLNALSASAFNSNTSCSPGTQPLEPEHRDGDLNEGPIIQSQLISNLLHH